MDAVTGWLAGYLGTVGVVFAAIMAAAFVIFSVERALYRVYLMSRVRLRWFPEGRFVLACTNGDERWDAYLEESLLPGIEDCVVIVDANEIGLAGDFERKLVEAFIGDKGMEPAVVVFLPNLERRTIRFSDALNTPGLNGETMLAAAKAALMGLVDRQREKMRLYI